MVGESPLGNLSRSFSLKNKLNGNLDNGDSFFTPDFMRLKNSESAHFIKEARLPQTMKMLLEQFEEENRSLREEISKLKNNNLDLKMENSKLKDFLRDYDNVFSRFSPNKAV